MSVNLSRALLNLKTSPSWLGFYALADDSDRPVGERIPGRLSFRAGLGDPNCLTLEGVFAATRPVTFGVPHGGMRRPYRLPRRWWELRGRRVQPQPVVRIGFFGPSRVLLWATDWKFADGANGDTITLSPVEIVGEL